VQTTLTHSKTCYIGFGQTKNYFDIISTTRTVNISYVDNVDDTNC